MMQARDPRPAPVDPQVWLVDLGDPRWDVDAAVADLAPDERAHAASAVEAVRRRRILLRAALRRIAGDRLGLRPSDVLLGNDRGRPVLLGSSLGVSCSRQGDVGVIALAEGPVGVDVAGVEGEDLTAALAEGWLTADEASGVARLAPTHQPAALARCWAQKEAVLKAEGVGLTRAPDTVATPLADRGPCGGWWLTSVPAPKAHVATLATRSVPEAIVVDRLHPGGAR